MVVLRDALVGRSRDGRKGKKGEEQKRRGERKTYIGGLSETRDLGKDGRDESAVIWDKISGWTAVIGCRECAYPVLESGTF